MRSTLMIFQIAACVVLAIGAALCVKSLRNANSIDVGFDTQHVALAIFNPRGMGYSGQKIADFYARRIRRIFPALILMMSCAWLAEMFAGLAQRPVQSTVAPGEIKRQLPSDPPEQAESMEAVLADLDGLSFGHRVAALDPGLQGQALDRLGGELLGGEGVRELDHVAVPAQERDFGRGKWARKRQAGDPPQQCRAVPVKRGFGRAHPGGLPPGQDDRAGVKHTDDARSRARDTACQRGRGA